MFSIGQRVMVNMAGFSTGGVSMGAGVSASGTIIGKQDGDYVVKLSIVAGGVDTVVVPESRLTPA